MGFDTYLDIADRTALMWRKQTSPLPRMLFRHDQLTVEALGTEEDREDDEFRYPVSVSYESTAAEALQVLDESGLGWGATLAAYNEIRFTGYSGGLFLAAAQFRERKDEGASEEDLRRFEALAPAHDLHALGLVLANQWGDSGVDEPLIFRDITYDGAIEMVSKFAFDVHHAAEPMNGVDEFAATRAAESWALLYRDAPLIAWPMLLVVLLKQLPPEAPVSLVLTEDAYETHGASTVEEGREYAERYWTESTEALAAYARTLGRLFGVLAGFNSQLGREFWFAKAAVSLAQLKEFTPENSTTTERGGALEGLVEALVKTEEPELEVIEKNFRTREEEIDLVAANSLTDPFWSSQGSPLIFVECKNTTEKPGVPELRILESKMEDRGAVVKIGIFISMHGFASTFLDRLKQIQRSGGMIFAVSGSDLELIINEKRRLTDWLRSEGLMRALGKT